MSWNRVLPSCVYVSSELSGRLWFAGDMVGHSCTIVGSMVHLRSLDNLDIACRLLPVASSTLVIRVVGRRASSSVLAAHEPDRSRCDDPTPAGFASAATSAFYFLRRSNGGTSFCSIERVVSSVIYLSLFRYSICPIIYLSASTSKRGTVIGSFLFSRSYV